MTTTQSDSNNVLRISRKGRNDLLFKLTKNRSHIVYCIDFDGEKGSTNHIFTNLGNSMEEKKTIIQQTLAYHKDYKLVDKVIAWFVNA